MIRTRDDLERAARAAGAVLLGTEMVQLRDGSWTLSGRFGYEDPWAAARLLCILREEDADDPAVQAWALALWDAAAAAAGLDPSDPRVSEAFLAAVHANVKEFVAFAPEEGERFQSARTTMIEGVGDCDCHAGLVHALVRAANLPSEIRFFEADDEPVHAVAAIGRMGDWAETTIDADYGEHPQDAYRRLGLAAGERPDIGAGPSHDDVVALQTRLQDAYLATALAVEQCPGLAAGDRSAWSALAQSVLAWDSADPDTADYGAGEALATQMAAFAEVLRSAGCTAPIPAPIPHAAPEPPPGESNWAGAVKVVAVAVAIVAGAVVATKLIPRRPRAAA